MNSYQDICAYIAAEGVARGYAVIPEVRLHLDGAWIDLDLVWVAPRPGPHAPPNPETGFLSRWQLITTFEVEGSNVPYAAFMRHLERLDFMESVQTEPFNRFVVLYTEHHARLGWGPEVDRTNELLGRVLWAAEYADRMQITDGPFLPESIAAWLG